MIKIESRLKSLTMIHFESRIFFQFQNLNEKINYRDREKKVDERT